MNPEQIDERVGEIIENAAPPLDPQLRTRALRAMDECRPARGYPPLRLIAIGVTGIAALVGIGFVRFPAGSARGAWDRALATGERATSLHVVGRVVPPLDDASFEAWASEDGFFRCEVRKDGEFCSLLLRAKDRDGKERMVQYDKSPSSQGETVLETYLPALHANCEPKRRWKWESTVVPEPEMFESPAYRISEHREEALWGGAVDVVEIANRPFRQPDGTWDGFQYRWEIDPWTGLALSVECSVLRGSRWVRAYWTECIEWNVDIPEDLWDFEPPPGSTVKRDTYWREHGESVLAAAATRDWQVTLRALEVNRRGDLFLGLCRGLTPDSRISPPYGGSPKIDAVDDTGARYEEVNLDTVLGAHRTIRLDRERPVSPADNPRRVTLTIYPHWAPFWAERSPLSRFLDLDPSTERQLRHNARISLDQIVVFKDLPLPLRQPVDDIFASYQEEIRY